MPDILDRWTREEVLALPDDRNRYEIIDGELLVSPSPRRVHQRVLRALFLRLHQWVTAGYLGEVYFSPADLELEPGQLLQPDLFVIPGPTTGTEWSDCAQPLLVIEVLSPSTARYDRQVKRRFYQRVGVPDYWVVDSDARLVEVWQPHDEKPLIAARDLVWSPTGGEPLVLDLPSLFAEALGVV